MSFEFVLSILFLLLSIILFIAVKFTKVTADDEKSLAYRDLEEARTAHKATKIAFGVGLGLFVLLTFFASAYTVPVNNIGIVTSFNAPTGRTTGNGLKFVWPWQKVADFDASRITENHVGDWNQGCTVVRIGSLATACVENRIQWQVNSTAAPTLYRIYKGNFNNLKTNFVDLEIQNALNATFATYNPLLGVDLKTGQTVFDGAKLAEDMKQRLSNVLSPFGITVYTVAIPLVHHDTTTEANIKAFQDVVLQSRILDQKRSNAEKEKAVSDLQREFLTPTYIQNKCIEYSKDMGFAPGLCMMTSGIVNAPVSK
jgi:regulator of protease activity HflC (stomatin/prohibitin superfamily)